MAVYRASLKFLWISLAVVLLDQITKYLCVFNIQLNTMGIEVLPFFNLVHVYNHGAAFSIFANMGGVQRYFLSGIALVLVVVFLGLLYKTKSDAKLQCLSYCLFIGGAIGNLIDRVLHGYVIDFLLFYLTDETGRIFWSYPAFNVADIAVFFGACLMVLAAFLHKEHKEPKDQPDQTTESTTPATAAASAASAAVTESEPAKTEEAPSK